MNRNGRGHVWISVSADEGAGSGGVALRFGKRRPPAEVDRTERQVSGIVRPRTDARDAGDRPEAEGDKDVTFGGIDKSK